MTKAAVEKDLQKWKRYFVFAPLLSCFVNILQLTFPFYMFAIYRNIGITYSSYSLGNITTAALMAVIANQTRSSYQAGTIQAIIKPMQNVIQVLIYCSGAWYGITRGFNIGLMVAASIIMGRALAPLMQFMGGLAAHWPGAGGLLPAEKILRPG